MKKLLDFLLKFYQKYLSILSYGSCRYHPTCSEYARWQFETNSFFKAIYFTITRILSCNQLFDGGFDYPKVKCNHQKFNLLRYKDDFFKKNIKIKYWYIPDNKNKCLVTKNWEYDK
jgi:putative membrane protein insertion efficiency factor